jgi:aspartyl-tRNA(Asn)/glutamyl-tRNA(Gln) amidotransferase subunit A
MQRWDLIATPAVAVPAFDARPAGHSPMTPEAMLAGRRSAIRST